MPTNEFINPNLHVILIHYPLALIGLGILIEVFSFLGWRRSSFRAAGRWMLLVGILSLPPVLLSGLYAMSDVNRTADTPLDATWIQQREGSPIQGQAWEYMKLHAWSSAFGSVALIAMLVLWMGSGDAWRKKLHFLYVLGVMAAFGALVWGAWHAGEMVYQHGVGVQVAHEAADAAEKRQIAYYAPPLQVHVILAGAVISLALAALGVSMRAAARMQETRSEGFGYGEAPADQTGIASALNPALNRPAYPGDRADPYDAPAEAPKPRAAAARWWLLATLIAIGASLTGVWTLAHFADIWEFDAKDRLPHLVSLVTDRSLNNGSMLTRRMVHSVAGGGIIVLLLMLSLLARLTAGRRFIVLLFSTLLIAVVVAQVWFGSLLMFDTPEGSITDLNGSEAALSRTVPAAETSSEKPSSGSTTLPGSLAAPTSGPSTLPTLPTTAPATTLPAS